MGEILGIALVAIRLCTLLLLLLLLAVFIGMMVKELAQECFRWDVWGWVAGKFRKTLQGGSLTRVAEVLFPKMVSAIEKEPVWPECRPPSEHDGWRDGLKYPVWLLQEGTYRPYKKVQENGTWRWEYDPVEQGRYDQEVADLQKRNDRKKFLQKALGTRIVSEEECAEAVDHGDRLFLEEDTYYPGVWYSCGCGVGDPKEAGRSEERHRTQMLMDLIAAQARLRKIARGEG